MWNNPTRIPTPHRVYAKNDDNSDILGVFEPALLDMSAVAGTTDTGKGGGHTGLWSIGR